METSLNSINNSLSGKTYKHANNPADILQLFTTLRKSGHFFTAVFIKKDDTIRQMHCRIGVKKYVNGKGMKYNPLEKGLLTVWDRQKEAYRMINLKRLLYISYGGVIHLF